MRVAVHIRRVVFLPTPLQSWSETRHLPDRSAMALIVAPQCVFERLGSLSLPMRLHSFVDGVGTNPLFMFNVFGRCRRIRYHQHSSLCGWCSHQLPSCKCRSHWFSLLVLLLLFDEYPKQLLRKLSTQNG